MHIDASVESQNLGKRPALPRLTSVRLTLGRADARDRDGRLMLVVGVREGRVLRYAGTVSFGVTRRVLLDWADRALARMCSASVRCWQRRNADG